MKFHAKTKINAENVEEASKPPAKTQKSASDGNGKMTKMLAAMEEINQASSSISKIIKVIEEIRIPDQPACTKRLCRSGESRPARKRICRCCG